MSKSTRALLAISGSLLLGIGCSKNEKAEVVDQPHASAPATGTATPDPDLMVVTITSIGLDTKLAAMCGIPTSKVFFKFDSAKLPAGAQDTLDQLATCAMTGPAKDQQLDVIGRTDPRGTDTYNQELGMSRADSVTKYLHDKGVDAGRVNSISKGEDDGIPDPWGWPYDRRVTVRIKG